jgi:hypothetical protein
MGYLHINNLYKEQDILLFKECYALQKIHGTSAHISFKVTEVRFFAGGESHERFTALFDQDDLASKFKELGINEITIYGEAYGGKQQGMSETYGKELKFVVFDVKIGDVWLDVPNAEQVATDLGLEFVYWEKVSTDLEELNRMRDMESQQAIRNGVGPGKKEEGVVLRPLIELTKNNGNRVICKHKRDDFRETKTPREVTPEQLKVLSDANEVAEEWVTRMRLSHVLDKVDGGACMDNMRHIIFAMCEDVKREGEGEIVWSTAVSKAISKRTAILTKDYFEKQLLTYVAGSRLKYVLSIRS